MPNFPGSENALPGAYSQVDTFSSGLSISSGVRSAVIMGEGARRETIVSSANGNGNDGFDPTYSGSNGSDGRHFLLTYAPVIENRSKIYKNGILLSGVEEVISGTFSNYDYRIDPQTGQIELRPASLVDQGGRYYKASASNTGTGTIGDLSLVDPNAPEESWTIRVSSVTRDGYGNPVSGQAKFVAVGSVSGSLLDGYGNTVFWKSDGTVVSNGILSFSISEGSTTFREGDRFTIEVSGGALLAGESLTASYIYESDINDPEFFTDLETLTQKHGSPSIDNNLSLGSQLSFANGTPGVWALQAAPSIPRRESYILTTSASGEADPEDLTFPLPLGVIPDADMNINFFVTSPVTGVESQIIPNKVEFYNSDITGDPAGEFIQNPAYVYSYTVIIDEDTATVKKGSDGYVAPISSTQAIFSSDDVSFGIEDINGTRSVYIYNATNPDNNGVFDIVSVASGILTIERVSGTFVEESDLQFEVVDSTDSVAKILLTEDLANNLPLGTQIRATVIDTKDADFFDAGWIAAYEALEALDIDIVVPLPKQTISSIFQNGASHVRFMSNIKNRKERVLFIGAISGLTPANVIGTEPAAVEDIGILEGIQGDDVSEILDGNIEDLADYGVSNSYGGTYRVVYFYPDQIVVQVGGSQVKIDGFYQAAAAAGYLCGVPNVALPLTRKNLTGFTILRDKLFRPAVLEQLTAAGITVLQPVLGGGKVIKGQTTTTSGYVEEQEISIIFIRDRISKQLRAGFDSFVGGADSDILKGALEVRGRSIMNGFITQNLITSWKDLKIERDTVDPTQWNITVKCQPVYPVNYIFIRVAVGLLE
jgi:hypothetical protein